MSVLSNRVVFNDEWDDIQKDPLFEKEISKRVGVIVKDGRILEGCRYEFDTKWNNGTKCGAWYLNLNNTSSNRNRNISSHLLYVHIKRKIVKVCYTMTLIYISEI